MQWRGLLPVVGESRPQAQAIPAVHDKFGPWRQERYRSIRRHWLLEAAYVDANVIVIILPIISCSQHRQWCQSVSDRFGGQRDLCRSGRALELAD